MLDNRKVLKRLEDRKQELVEAIQETFDDVVEASFQNLSSREINEIEEMSEMSRSIFSKELAEIEEVLEQFNK